MQKTDGTPPAIIRVPICCIKRCTKSSAATPKQAGSLVAPDRLRFDFTHFQPLTPEEIAAIEERVNARILENLPVTTAETTFEEATKAGAIALFGEKYSDHVPGCRHR